MNNFSKQQTSHMIQTHRCQSIVLHLVLTTSYKNEYKNHGVGCIELKYSKGLLVISMTAVSDSFIFYLFQGWELLMNLFKLVKQKRGVSISVQRYWQPTLQQWIQQKMLFDWWFLKVLALMITVVWMLLTTLGPWLFQVSPEGLVNIKY